VRPPWPPAALAPSSANAIDDWPVAEAGKQAIVAVGRSILIIVSHLLAEPDTTFNDLDPGFYELRVNASRQTRTHLAGLEAPRLQGHARARRLNTDQHRLGRTPAESPSPVIVR
jgi:hypothetical protein